MLPKGIIGFEFAVYSALAVILLLRIWEKRGSVFPVFRSANRVERIAGICLLLALAFTVAYDSNATKPNGPRSIPPVDTGGGAGTNTVLSMIPPCAVSNGFLLTEARTNESYVFLPPGEGTVRQNWRLRGAHEDLFSLSFPGGGFPFREESYSNILVSVSGNVFFGGLSSNDSVRPFPAPLSFTPESVTPSNSPSLFWSLATPSNSLTLTWLNAFFLRDTNSPVSFQTEFFPSGDFAFRYGASASARLPELLPTMCMGITNSSVPAAPSSLIFRRVTGADLLDPDRDGDGIATYDEWTVSRTDPDNPDTDGDGMPDGWEVNHGLSPLDPSDADSDADGDGIPSGAEFRFGLDPQVNERTAFWVTDSPLGSGDASVSFRLTDAPSCPVVLAVGKSRAVMRDTNWRAFAIRQGVEYRLTVAVTDCPTGTVVRLACESSPSWTVLDDPLGICSETGVSLAATNGGYAEASGTYCEPVLRVSPAHACFHGNERRKTLRATILPHGLAGSYSWRFNGEDIPARAITVGRGAAPSEASAFFRGGTAHPRLSLATGVQITACAVEDDPALDDGDELPTAGDDGGMCCTAGCACGCRLTGRCGCRAQEDPPSGSGGGNGGTAPGGDPEPEEPYPVSVTNDTDRLTLAVNDDDDDGDGTADRTVLDCVYGEDDLVRVPGLSDCGSACCPCHPSTMEYAVITGHSSSLRLWTDSMKSSAWQGGNVNEYTAIYAEGLTPSAMPGDAEVHWQVHRSDGTTESAVTQFTILGLRLFPELDGDGTVATNDVARFRELNLSQGWSVPAFEGKRHALLLRSGVALPGVVTLSLDGPSGVFSLYADEEGGEPVAVSGGASVTLPPSPGDTTWWLEAETTAVCRVTADFAGSGDAAEYACSAELPVTAFLVTLREIAMDENGEPLLDLDGNLQPGEEIDSDTLLSGYVPETERGAPAVQNLASNVPGWVEFRASETDAFLTVASTLADSARGWTFGPPTNGVYRCELDDGWIDAEIQTNVEQSAVELALLTDSPELTGETNPVPSRIPVVETVPRVWATRRFTGEREDIGPPPLCARNGFFIRTDGMPSGGYAELSTPGENEVILLDGQTLARGDTCIIPVIADESWSPPGDYTDRKFYVHKLYTTSHAPSWTIQVSFQNSSAKDDPCLDLKTGMPMLISGMITDEKFCTSERVENMDNAAGVAKSMGIGVTPLFSPDKDALVRNLKKNRIWIHYGHGNKDLGIQIAKLVSNNWRTTFLTAGDIRAMNIKHRYDLVFMNTCDSTDKYYTYDHELLNDTIPKPFTNVEMNVHAVYDIGLALRAKNYIGWDCEVQRELSAVTPTHLLKYLKCPKGGTPPSVDTAVKNFIKQKKDAPGIPFSWMLSKLRLVISDDSVRLDQRKKGKKK
ncbi:MAG: hypothetical protein IKR48_04585 [Kiritimatiellae bacterium]|nr:hypothetical protein [Kiritimatiellia bacterium]